MSMQPTPTRPRRPSTLRRYGPILAVLVVIVVVVLIVSLTGGGGSSPKKSSVSAGGPGKPPVMFTKGSSIDWGPNCDTTTGRVKLPTIYAPPCVQPFSGDNGGATSPGVTADAITVAVYVAQPDPLQQALVGGAGATASPETNADTAVDFGKLWAAHTETYGRKVDFVKFKATGGPTDEAAAKADAIKIATDIKPFAVFGGPTQTTAFADELAARKILCLATCSVTFPDSFTSSREPYLWLFTPGSTQSATLSAEFIGKELKGGKAIHGGDAVKNKKRVFGVLHYDTADGQYAQGFQTFKEQLGKYDVKLATEISFPLDLNRAPELARSAIAQLKSAGVTSVILNADPLMPKYFTQEATRQGYFPEWVIGPSLFVDYAVFGRTYDQQQWVHAFGVSFSAARGDQKTQDAYNLYVWQYGREPQSNNYQILNLDAATLMTGAQLAGPILTPATFENGLFRAPVTGGGPTTPTISRGKHGLWPTTDWAGIDDATVVWWNPKASGVNENGNNGAGLYEFADQGKRYRPGQFPKGESGLFDPATSVLLFKEIPASDRPPVYPSPANG
jgi:hypothetical protein